MYQSQLGAVGLLSPLCLFTGDCFFFNVSAAFPLCQKLIYIWNFTPVANSIEEVK